MPAKPLDLVLIAQAVADGKTVTEIAKLVGMTRMGLYKRAKKEPRLAAILKKANKKRGPQRKPIDYEVVKALAEVQCAEYVIAEKIHLERTAFMKRKQTDVDLINALAAGKAEGEMCMRQQIYRSAMDRYMTICKKCEKISEDKFRAKCAFCNSDDVTHKFVPGNPTAQVWWTKNNMGWRDQPAPEMNDNEMESDGFMEALKANAKDDWKEARSVQVASTEQKTASSDALVDD